MASKVTPLGELLKRRREAAGFSRVRVAELSGVNASSIEAWELGRVSKPPIHDVLRLARCLSIPMGDIERAVMQEDGIAAAPPASSDVPAGAGLPLLERAIASLGWSDTDAANALDTSIERVGALRRGDGQLSVIEVLSLIAVLAAFPAERGGASEAEVAEVLTQLREPRATTPPRA